MCAAAAGWPPRCERRWFFLQSLRGSGKQLPCEPQYVIPPLRSGGALTSTTLRPIVEILAEPRAMLVCEEIAIGRGEDTHVDGARAILTDAPHLAFLQDT